MAGRRFKQGYYTLVNPEKYIGDPTKVRYMSSWELETHKFFDCNPNILKWSSEEIAIPYMKPTDNKMHRYYPDYFIQYRTRTGEIKWELLEVKPAAQTKVSRSRNPQTKLYENLTYAVNASKWQAAQLWCEQQSQLSGKNISFRVVTERSIFR